MTGKVRVATIVATLLIIQTIAYGLWAQEAPKREMRGIWVSSVANIDWPSRPALSSEQLKAETIGILDNLVRLGFNCVFLQVRPSADALYNSPTEPWSAYLTGSQGAAPANDFDPLQFWTEEAHKRGIELHAWINPFRATTGKNQQLAQNHITSTHPEWIIYYDDKGYIDPGNPEARKYIYNIINHIAQNYDIDGIHIDDYFYPYPSPKKTFADTASFRIYNTQKLTIEQWRRQNINTFVKEAHQTVKDAKPWLLFGVSPFGVWRNDKDDKLGSKTNAGVTAYDALNADILAWMHNGWIDYVIPQIYWESTHPTANFNTLAEWWSKQEGCQIYIGHALYKIDNGAPAWKDKDEMPQQLIKARSISNIDGSVMFSYKQFSRELLGLHAFLTDTFYRTKALTPQIKSSNESIKIGEIKKKKHILQWTSSDDENTRFYVIYRYNKKKDCGSTSESHIWRITSENSIRKENGERGKQFYRVAPLDKYRKEHNASKKVKF